MKFFAFLFLANLFVFSNQAHCDYPIPEFEFVVVENIPENIHLGMTLKEIEKAKHGSRISHHKKLIYSLLTQKVSPLLSQSSFSDGDNILQLIQSIPGQEIVKELIEQQKKIPVDVAKDSDFLIFIVPKRPREIDLKNHLPYTSFYSSNKAPVIDSHSVNFLAEKPYEELINLRMQKAVDFSFSKHHSNGSPENAFFVGGMFAVKLRGNQTTLTLQVVAGLPTDQEFSAPIEQPEAKFNEFRLPKTPNKKWFSREWTDYPGAILTLNYSESSAAPLKLHIQFGSLGKIKQGAFVPDQSPQPYSELKVGWKNMVGVIFKRYNVPHLYGTEFAPIGKVILNDWSRDIQVNIHEVSVDLNQFEVSNMRVSVEFPPKTIWGGWNLSHNFMPRIEQPELNEKFKQGANEQLSPHRKKLQALKQQFYEQGLLGPLLDSKNRQQLTTLILNTLDSKQRATQ